MMNTVPFEPGQRVRLKHDPGRIGVITGKTRKYGTVRIGEITPLVDSPNVPLIQRPIRVQTHNRCNPIGGG